jgi:hypothetical protein
MLRMSWYWILGWFLFLTFFASVGASIFLIPLGVSDGHAYTVMLCLLFTAVLWLSWVSPILDSTIRRHEWKLRPAHHTRNNQILAWVPTALMLIPLLVLIVVIFSLEKDKVIERLTQAPLPFMFILWISLSLGSIVTTVLVRRFTPRLAKQRKICFLCGYSLRGKPDVIACPECGEPVPWIKQEESIAADPGQGPAGHDRA